MSPVISLSATTPSVTVIQKRPHVEVEVRVKITIEENYNFPNFPYNYLLSYSYIFTKNSVLNPSENFFNDILF